MTDDELRALLTNLREQMLNEEDGELSERRQDNLDRYLGEPYGNEQDGYSRYVTREVMEAVEWALPSLLRIFTAGDRVVVFEPVGEEDEKQAEQETDVVNHYLLKENNGFMAFYEWFKDALIYPNGYAKIWTEEVTEARTERYTGITEEGLVQLSQDNDAEIVAASSYEEIVDTPQGPMPVVFYDLEVKVTKKCHKLRFESVPPEQVLVDSDLTSVSLDESRAVCHRSQRTKSWLLEAGYDPALLDEVSSDTEAQWNSERVNRLDTQDEYFGSDSEADESMRTYWLEEWYLRVDFDGDGVAERRKVDVIGGEVFENIEYDYQPMVALSSIPMTHRHAGLSLADLVKPIQELSTYLQRGINDNIAAIKRPRKYVAEGGITADGSTLDALLDPEADVITVRQPGMIEAEQHQPIITELLAVKAGVVEQSQLRTGVAPNMTLNPEVLQQSTAEAFGQAMTRANERVELIARIFAETGIRDAMIKAHRQIKEHQDVPKTVKIRGEWIQSNPSDWRDRHNVTVNVGLGFASKESQLQASMQLLTLQKEALSIGMATPQNLYNALEDVVEALGRKSVERYFTMPEQQEQQQQQPDPLAMAQVQLANKQIEALEREQARKDWEAQKEQARKDAELDAKLEKTNAETQEALADAAKAATEAGSAQIRQQAEVLAPEFASDV